jgi:hypothetical protein
MKGPKFEKELTSLAMAKKHENQTFLPLQLYHGMTRAMAVRIATARSVISTQHTAVLATPLRLRHLMTSLIVYKRTDRKEPTHPKYHVQRPYFRTVMVKKEEPGIL